jgi:hypothetical protein
MYSSAGSGVRFDELPNLHLSLLSDLILLGLAGVDNCMGSAARVAFFVRSNRH